MERILRKKCYTRVQHRVALRLISRNTMGSHWGSGKPKHSWETWRKREKQKHVENYTDLVECLANMGDWKKKTEQYEREQLAIGDDGDWVILLNIYKKNRMNLLVHFGIYGHSWWFESSNFENFQNITRAHKSRTALTFIRFPIHINHFIDTYSLYNMLG